MIEAFGGKCCICGYNKCDDAIDFHHVDPAIKDFHMGQMRSDIKGWATIVKELRKCVMVCTRCHKEVHSPRINTSIPDDAPRFNEKYADYKILQHQSLMNKCPICKTTDKPKYQQTCSYQCAAVKSGKTDWSKIDVVALVNECGSFTNAGHTLDLSAAAVSRRYKKVTGALSKQPK
jgi:hypothetical protein